MWHSCGLPNVRKPNRLKHASVSIVLWTSAPSIAGRCHWLKCVIGAAILRSGRCERRARRHTHDEPAALELPGSLDDAGPIAFRVHHGKKIVPRMCGSRAGHGEVQRQRRGKNGGNTLHGVRAALKGLV